MANSFMFAGSQSLITLFIASLAAYCFAHLRFPGRAALFAFSLVGLMVPLGVIVLPTQRIVSGLGWLNSVQGLVIPLTASAFALFLLTEYMRAVPKELIEAATVDGVGKFGIYWRIALPLTRNGLLAVGILVCVMAWSNFLWPLVTVTKPGLYPVSVAAATYFNPQSKFTTGDMMAAALLSALPLIVVYGLLQRWIVDSISRAGLRG
jgi:multiple sugar transport system permease protein